MIIVIITVITIIIIVIMVAIQLWVVNEQQGVAWQMVVSAK